MPSIICSHIARPLSPKKRKRGACTPSTRGFTKTRTTIHARLHSAPNSRDHADLRNARRDPREKDRNALIIPCYLHSPPTHWRGGGGCSPCGSPGLRTIIIPDKAHRHESQSPRGAQSSQPGLRSTLQVMLVRVELSSPGYKYSRAEQDLEWPFP